METISSNNYQGIYLAKKTTKKHTALKTAAILSATAAVGAGAYYAGKNPDVIKNIRAKFLNKEKIASYISTIKTFMFGIGFGKICVNTLKENNKKESDVQDDKKLVEQQNKQKCDDVDNQKNESICKTIEELPLKFDESCSDEKKQELIELINEIKAKFDNPADRELFYNTLGFCFFNDTDVDIQALIDSLHSTLEKDKQERLTEKIIPTENGYKRIYHVPDELNGIAFPDEIVVEDEYVGDNLTTRKSRDAFGNTFEIVDFKNKKVLIPNPSRTRETVYDFKKEQILDYIINLSNDDRICAVLINPNTKKSKITPSGMSKGLLKEYRNVKEFAKDASDLYAQLQEKYFPKN